MSIITEMSKSFEDAFLEDLDLFINKSSWMNSKDEQQDFKKNCVSVAQKTKTT